MIGFTGAAQTRFVDIRTRQNYMLEADGCQREGRAVTLSDRNWARLGGGQRAPFSNFTRICSREVDVSIE